MNALPQPCVIDTFLFHICFAMSFHGLSTRCFPLLFLLKMIACTRTTPISNMIAGLGRVHSIKISVVYFCKPQNRIDMFQVLSYFPNLLESLTNF